MVAVYPSEFHYIWIAAHVVLRHRLAPCVIPTLGDTLVIDIISASGRIQTAARVHSNNLSGMLDMTVKSCINVGTHTRQGISICP